MKFLKLNVCRRIDSQFLTASLVASGLLVGLLVNLSACVTVNVNFPESAVQKAADDYVKDIYRAKEKTKTPDTSPSATPAKTQSLAPSFFLSEAWAEITFQVKSSKALKIRDRLAKRIDDVIEQKKAGVFGESNDGLLVLKAPEKLKKLLLKKMEALVEEENADREDLYKEVLSLNQMSKNRLKDVQKSFARSFQAESPLGTWIQDDDGTWKQKE